MEWNDRRGFNRSWVEHGTGGVPELPRWLRAGAESALDIRSRPPTLGLSQYGLTPDMATKFPHLASTVYPSDASLYGGLGNYGTGRYSLLNSETPAAASAVSAPYFPSSTLTPGVSALPPSGLGLNHPLLSTRSNILLPSDDYLASGTTLLHPHQFAPLERREEPLSRLGDYVLHSSLAAPPRDRDLLPRSGLSHHSLLPLKRSRYSPPRSRSPIRRGRSPRRRGRSPPRDRSPLKKSLKRASKVVSEGKSANLVADRSKKAGITNQDKSKDVKAKKQDKSKQIGLKGQDTSKEVEAKKNDKSKEIDAQKEDKGKEVEVKTQDAAPAPIVITETDAKEAALTDKPTIKNPVSGMIFGCNNATEQECRRLQLFGLPSARENDVLRVVPGTKLFLYNFDSKELSGVYEASSKGGIDIIPHAFKSFGSFPAQVRIKRIMKAPNLPLKVFKEAIKENFYSHLKFNYELNASQVEKLVALFSSANVKATA